MAHRFGDGVDASTASEEGDSRTADSLSKTRAGAVHLPTLDPRALAASIRRPARSPHSEVASPPSEVAISRAEICFSLNQMKRPSLNPT